MNLFISFLLNSALKKRHLILEDNEYLSLENVGVEKGAQSSLTQLEYLSFEGSHLQKIESNLFWPLRLSSKLTQGSIHKPRGQQKGKKI